MNAKQKGSRAEREARDILKSWGYGVVRAAGSLGPWDLVALPRFKGEPVLLVQCKCNGWPGPDERKIMRLELQAYQDSDVPVCGQAWNRCDGKSGHGQCGPYWVTRDIDTDWKMAENFRIDTLAIKRALAQAQKQGRSKPRMARAQAQSERRE